MYGRKLLNLLLVVLALGAFLRPASTAALSATTIIKLTNQQRLEAGLRPLKTSPALMASALAKARDMFKRNYWAHYGPDGESPWGFMTQDGYRYSAAGENLAMNFNSDDSVMSAWMASPAHRDNILNSRYIDLGVAVVSGRLNGQDTTLVVAHYGAPAPKPNSELAHISTWLAVPLTRLF